MDCPYVGPLVREFKSLSLQKGKIIHWDEGSNPTLLRFLEFIGNCTTHLHLLLEEFPKEA